MRCRCSFCNRRTQGLPWGLLQSPWSSRSYQTVVCSICPFGSLPLKSCFTFERSWIRNLSLVSLWSRWNRNTLVSALFGPESCPTQLSQLPWHRSPPKFWPNLMRNVFRRTHWLGWIIYNIKFVWILGPNLEPFVFPKRWYSNQLNILNVHKRSWKQVIFPFF